MLMSHEGTELLQIIYNSVEPVTIQLRYTEARIDLPNSGCRQL